MVVSQPWAAHQPVVAWLSCPNGQTAESILEDRQEAEMQELAKAQPDFFKGHTWIEHLLGCVFLELLCFFFIPSHVLPGILLGFLAFSYGSPEGVEVGLTLDLDGTPKSAELIANQHSAGKHHRIPIFKDERKMM